MPSEDTLKQLLVNIFKFVFLQLIHSFLNFDRLTELYESVLAVQEPHSVIRVMILIRTRRCSLDDILPLEFEEHALAGAEQELGHESQLTD
jgi:hypothetical protein